MDSSERSLFKSSGRKLEFLDSLLCAGITRERSYWIANTKQNVVCSAEQTSCRWPANKENLTGDGLGFGWFFVLVWFWFW